MRTADVVVIGGGLPRCSTALHLALRGLKPILVEKDYAGRHASGVNVGVRQLAPPGRDPAVHFLDGAVGEDRTWSAIAVESHGTVLVAENEETAGFRARVSFRLKGHARGDRSREPAPVPAVADRTRARISRRDGAADPFRTTQVPQARHREGAGVGVTVTG
jgi:sarcosine oxidase subunit beta